MTKWFFPVSIKKQIAATIIQLPNTTICGGVLLPGQRVASHESCVPYNFLNTKVRIPGLSMLLDILHVSRGYVIIIHVSSSKH